MTRRKQLKLTALTSLLLPFLSARAQPSLYPPNFNASDELFAYLPATNITICYQTIGNPADPALILVGGAASSMMLFSPQWIHLLSPPSDPHYIIRFDARDTGRSTSFPLVTNATSPPPYLLGDLIADLVGLMDHLAVPVHLAGFSSGGPIAFAAAAQRPHLAKSLFLGLTSPVGLEGYDGLPPARPLNGDIAAQLGPPPVLSDPEERWVDYLLRSQFLLYSQPPDEVEAQQQRVINQEIYRRGIANGTLVSSTNHIYALLHSGRWPREALRDIACPALVMSATLDQTFDPVHGRTLAADLARGEFTLYEDSAHELPQRIWGRLSRDMLRVMAEGESWWTGMGYARLGRTEQ